MRRRRGEYTDKPRIADRRARRGRSSMRGIFGPARMVMLAAGLMLVWASPAVAAEAVTYLFPAPPSLPAFGPIQLAKGKGYFAGGGLDVSFAVGRGRGRRGKAGRRRQRPAGRP